MLAAMPSYYSVDSFVTNRYRLLCSIQLVSDLQHCSSVAMTKRYISVLIPPAEVTQSSSQIITRVCHIIFSALMLNIFLELLKPSCIQFICTFDVVSRRSVLTSNCAVDIAPTQSPVDSTWRQWTYQPRHGLFVVDRLSPYAAALSMFLLQYFM